MKVFVYTLVKRMKDKRWENEIKSQLQLFVFFFFFCKIYISLFFYPHKKKKEKKSMPHFFFRIPIIKISLFKER